MAGLFVPVPDGIRRRPGRALVTACRSRVPRCRELGDANWTCSGPVLAGSVIAASYQLGENSISIKTLPFVYRL